MISKTVVKAKDSEPKEGKFKNQRKQGLQFAQYSGPFVPSYKEAKDKYYLEYRDILVSNNSKEKYYVEYTDILVSNNSKEK